MSNSVGQIAFDIVLGRETFSSSIKKSINECAKDVTDGSKTIGTKINSIGECVSNVGSAMVPMSTAVGGFGLKTIKMASNFETAMAQVSAVSGATGEDFEKLSAKAREMGSKTKFSASQSAEAMNYMAMAGWKTEDMLDGISGIMDLAAASGENLGTTSDIVTDALTAFGLKASDSSHFADVLASASSNANTNVSMMGETFKYVAPLAGAMGYSVEDTSVAIGLMANAGIKGSEAGTALRSMITRLAKPTKESGTAMDALGISITNSDGSMKSFSEVLETLRSKFSGLSADEKAQYSAMLAGQEGMSGLLAIVNASDDDFTKLSSAINNCDGTTAKMAGTMQNNLGGQMANLNSAFEELQISLGEALMPVITDFISKVQNVVNWFNSLDDGTKKIITNVGMFLVVVAPATILIGKLISGVGSIVGLFGKLTGHLGNLASSASSAVAPVASAGQSMSGLVQAGLGLLAAGAGIALASAGMFLLAKSAIDLHNAGLGAIGTLGLLVVGVGALAVVFAMSAPAFTAGAVGMIAFGGAIALIGAGVFLATSGLTLLGAQLPDISQYGLQASLNIVALAGAIGLLGTGSIVCAVGVVALGVGMLGASIGVLAFGVGLLVAGAGITLVGVGLALIISQVLVLTSVGAGISIILFSISGSMTALGGSALIAGGALVAFDAGMMGLAGSTALAVGAMTGLSAIFVVTIATSLLLAGSIGLLKSNVEGIRDASNQTCSSLMMMQSSVNIVEVGVNALKDKVANAVDSIINLFSEKRSTLEGTARDFGNAMTKGVESGMKQAPDKVNSIVNNINSNVQKGNNNISNTMRNLQNTVNQTLSSIQNSGRNMSSSLNSSFSQIKGNWGNTFNGLRNSARDAMNGAEHDIENSIDRIERKFKNADFNFNQRMKLPHFSMRGNFDAQSGKTPEIKVDWYKKAYDDAYLLNSPTIFGASGGKLLGGGEGNESEAVVGTGKLTEIVQNAMQRVLSLTEMKLNIQAPQLVNRGTNQSNNNNNNNEIISLLQALLAKQQLQPAGNGGDTVIPIYLDGNMLDEVILNAQNRRNLRSGGR